jgi:hypothetical protein
MNYKNATITIVSVIISALVVRAIYSIFEYIRLLCHECTDGKEDDYEEMCCGLIRTLIVVLICTFLIILVYEILITHTRRDCSLLKYNKNITIE